MLLVLLLLHFVIDFLPQLSGWSKIRQRTERGSRWVTHAAIQGLAAATILLLFTSSAWLALAGGVVILLSHWLINIARSYIATDSFASFAIGQALHAVVILSIGVFQTGGQIIPEVLAALMSPKLLTVALAYVLVLRPVSVLIRTFLDPWIQQIKNGDSSLAQAGTVIGYLERVLILTFIFADEYMAIGVVLALKAAYRFKDTGEHPKTEYLLMGTFLSLLLTLFIGAGAKLVLDLL